MTERDDLDGLTPEEANVARRLAARADLLRTIEPAAGEPDETFAGTLRAHLLYGEELAPHPTFARRLRRHLTRRSGARPVRRPRRRVIPWLGGLAAIAAIAAAVLLALPRGTGFQVPYPQRADLLFNLPFSTTATPALSPTLSLVHLAPAVPYAGPVRLIAHSLQQPAKAIRGYQLRANTSIVATDRRRLGIRSPVRTVVVGGAAWLVASDGGPSSHRPLHSLAMSLASGELIYHDRRNFRLPFAAAAARPAVAVRVARSWLTRLGWPGRTMALKRISGAPGLPKVQQVVLSWPDVGGSTIDQATLWVAPDRSVIEAWVWPPVARSGNLSARSVADAWSDVTAGKAPIVVRGTAPGTRATAAATLRSVKLVTILIPRTNGTSYLVPAYEFAGTATIGATGSTRQWVSVAPGAQR